MHSPKLLNKLATIMNSVIWLALGGAMTGQPLDSSGPPTSTESTGDREKQTPQDPPPAEETKTPVFELLDAADEPPVKEEEPLADSQILSFLNFGLKETNQPHITMEDLEPLDLGVLPKEYFIVLDREGDGDSLVEWISGEFLRIRESSWEGWRPANELIRENILTGKVVMTIPTQKFAVLLADDGGMRSALLRMKGRLWAVNMSRQDGFSPVIPLIPEDLFYEHVRDKNKAKQENK